MSVLLLLLALQVSGWTVSPARPTVGDTVTLVRRVAAEPAASVRPDPITASEFLQPLMAPRWSYAEGEIAVVYRVAFFSSGEQRVAVPAVDITYADGRVVTLPSAIVNVTVTSVLPDVPTARLRPQASVGPIARPRQRLLPVVLLPGSVLVGVVLLVAWRRRRAPRPAVPEILHAEAQVPLEDWIAAGESRAAATVVALKLRGILAALVPEVRAHEDTDQLAAAILEEHRSTEAVALVAALRALERARFSPAAPADIHEVIDEAERAVREFEAAQMESV